MYQVLLYIYHGQNEITESFSLSLICQLMLQLSAVKNPLGVNYDQMV